MNYYRFTQNAYGQGLVGLRELAPYATPLQVFNVGSLVIEATSGETAGKILAHYQENA